jgi:hypothetical protein
MSAMVDRHGREFNPVNGDGVYGNDRRLAGGGASGANGLCHCNGSTYLASDRPWDYREAVSVLTARTHELDLRLGPDIVSDAARS